MDSTMQHEVIDLGWFTAFYADLLTWFPDEKVEISRDLRAAKAQISNGNLSFFTQDLPRAHNELLGALEHGGIAPKFSHLRWLTLRVLEAPCHHERAIALKCHRQLAHALYKLETSYEEATLGKAYQAYTNTEEDLKAWSEKVSQPEGALADLLLRARYHLVSSLPCIDELSRTVALRECLGVTPGHGPGSVATGERGDDKWAFKRLYASLHARFPYYDWFLCRGNEHLLDRVRWYKGLQRIASPCSKVVAVPKDSRGPRLISEEPLEVQYLQQGYLRLMMRWSRKRPFKDHVLFDDQSHNRALALASSKDGSCCTIDLKDASDRVHRALVKALFPECIFRDLDALRSTHTLLDGKVYPLLKMSPMGSSVCFPTMAFCIWALCVTAMEYHYGDDVRSYMHGDHFCIFGDDVIVPTELMPWVTHCLELVGLKVNKDKSFARSRFRESCGVDAYNGIDITPTRIRELGGPQVMSDGAYLAHLAYVNSLRRKGWFATADKLEHRLQHFRGSLPLTWDEQDYPGILVDRNRALNVPIRWSHAQSRLMAYVETPTANLHRSRVRGWDRLLRNLTMGPGETPDMTTVRGDVRMRKHWVKIT